MQRGGKKKEGGVEGRRKENARGRKMGRENGKEQRKVNYAKVN